MRSLGDTDGPSEGDSGKAGLDTQGKQETDPAPGPGQGLPTASQTSCCLSDRPGEGQQPFSDAILTNR